jgi:hypothetical protein
MEHKTNSSPFNTCKHDNDSVSVGETNLSCGRIFVQYMLYFGVEAVESVEVFLMDSTTGTVSIRVQ